MSYFTYILKSQKTGKYYIGSCENINIRLQQHNSGHTTYTKTGIPWILVYSEVFETRSEAQSQEYAIKKKKSRIYIENLIANKGDDRHSEN
jgi:putative endonuclease